jgi:hypothetical protein
MDPGAELEALERALSRARPGMDRHEQEEVAGAALGALFGAGLALGNGALSRADLERVIDRTREKLSLVEAGLDELVQTEPNALANEIVYPDVYEDRALTRSALQYAIDLYWDGATPPALAEGLDRFDYMLEQAAEHGAALAPEDIPAAVPREHWWWRAPYQARPAG